MKRLVYLIMFFILINSVFADKVSIFNFNYDNGKITLKEQLIKEGYYPDRKIQVDEGYSCKLVDKNNNNLYSFRFELPMKLYTDVIDNNRIVGNIIILNETDFSFIIPYIPESKSIVCSNPRGYEVLKEEVIHITMSYKKSNPWLWFFVMLVLILLIVIIYKQKRKKLNK